MDLVRTIAQYRNERIRVTKNLHGLREMVYHVIKRVPGAMQIFEESFDMIDVDNITLLPDRGNINNTYFTDGRHTYHFSSSKNTLYMIFNDMELLDTFEVNIMDDPYSFLMGLNERIEGVEPVASIEEANRICLRLYSTKSDGTKFVAEKSGLNQWNADGRPRHPNEIYIPYPAEDRVRTAGFFPDRNTPFDLLLPDGSMISAKVCQQDGKAIMSNPNKDLGEWLLRNVFELPEGTKVTYEMLLRFGIDCVVFTKLDELRYSVNFAEIGTYEEWVLGLTDEDDAD